MTNDAAAFTHSKVTVGSQNALPQSALASFAVGPKSGNGNAYAFFDTLEAAEQYACALDAKAEAEEDFLKWFEESGSVALEEELLACAAAADSIGAVLTKEQDSRVLLPIALQINGAVSYFRDARLALLQLELHTPSIGPGTAMDASAAETAVQSRRSKSGSSFRS